MKKIKWCFYYIKSRFERFLDKIGHKDMVKHRYKKELLNTKDTYKLIHDWILEGEPRMIARYGGNETRAACKALGVKLGIKKNIQKKLMNNVYMNAGVFPYGKEMVCKFGDLMIEMSKEVDLLGVWSSTMQDYLVNNYLPSDARITLLGNLEPYNDMDNPWTYALKGKKVLVIHPYEKTIQSQYEKRKVLFSDNENLLPDFELKTLKAVQSIGGAGDSLDFKDWFEALDYMYEEAMKIDFDVAIIGCGAYGFPLAAKLKQAGKISIHLGGSTQILFGIKGKRWDANPQISKLYNEHWVRPSQDETPVNADTIEDGCYW